MNGQFNPLQSKLAFARPERLHLNSAWVEHIPFAMLLVELQRPRLIVELGTHWGVSYCAWCQAVAAIGAQTRCFAVDTWIGDSHVGSYGDDVYEDLKEHHRQYESFSTLLRMTFDEALEQFEDRSVDLLHIDGSHTYEDVKRDYDTWIPKVSDRGIILFHDTSAFERGFGVHRLWGELSPNFRHFNFEHGFGLGILAVGKDQAEAVMSFLQAANAYPDNTRELFSALGGRFQSEAIMGELNRLRKVEKSRDYRWGKRIVTPLRRVKRFLGVSDVRPG